MGHRASAGKGFFEHEKTILRKLAASAGWL
jgi:hypothetical protein